jgi:DNA-binding ferritin-like protein
MIIAEALTKVFCSNYVAYHKSHAAHVNIVGRNFGSDHKLLQKVYEDLQAEIDTIGELLRTIDSYFPLTVSETIEGSDIPDDLQPDFGDGLGYIEQIYQDLEALIEVYLELEDVTQNERGYNHLANYAQDRVRALKKHNWMLKATLENRRPDFLA